jgi:hypothetical protein
MKAQYIKGDASPVAVSDYELGNTWVLISVGLDKLHELTDRSTPSADAIPWAPTEHLVGNWDS